MNHPDRPVLRVLLVDDDEDELLLVSALLKSVKDFEFQVRWADSFDSGHQMIATGDCDVVLIDYRLGERNGIELLSEVAHLSKAPCILLTGQGDRSVDLEAMKAGAADYLAKSELTAPLLERTIRYAVDRRRAEERLTHLALYDPLTGLANRSLFRDRLGHEMSRVERFGEGLALLFLDLDRFKRINDTLGHGAGDDLLRTVAGRLSRCARKVDTIARLGGDEFVMILSGVTAMDQARVVANRILTELAEPFELMGRPMQVSASIGVTMYPQDSNDLDSLLKNADLAMYSAKEMGRNGFQFYKAEMAMLAARQLEIENRLRFAIERGELRLHYQPQVDLTNGRIKGLEGLIRWRYDKDTLLMPGEFLPVVEEVGLMPGVGEWVVQEACAHQRAWMDAGLEVPLTSVNVSPTQLRNPDLAGQIEEALGKANTPASHFGIELTESTLMADPDRACNILRRLVDMGVNVAIDDFGTGYSSLSCLRDFPLSVLKMDRAFVKDVPHDAKDSALVSSIVTLGHHLDLQVTAEGVERADQLDFLRDAGCDSAQGYYFSMPVPEPEVRQLLKGGTCLP